MTSLTTLFIVGPEEYVEFNESMGSKAFLEHVWDESAAPLERKDTSAAGVQLHSAGARIAGKPPRIEFPTILRQRGNKFKASGRFISWDELRRLNPLAIAAPPSLAEFEKRGAKVGTGEQVKPGAWLEHKRVKVEVGADGWYGKGAAESVYAATQEELEADAREAKALADETANSTDEEEEERAHTPTKAAAAGVASSSLRKSGSRSLFERLGMDTSSPVGLEAAPAPAPSSTTLPASVPSASSGQTPPGKRRTASTLRIPMPVSTMTSFSPGSTNGALPTPIARTPLSATHPPPDTPLKHLIAGKRAGASELTPLTPSAESNWPISSSAERSPSINGRAKGLGLGGVEEGGSPLSLASSVLAATPPSSLASLPSTSGSEFRRSPLSSHSKLSVSPARPPAASASAAAAPASSAQMRIDAMLEKLRSGRSSSSPWASSASSASSTSAAVPAPAPVQPIDKTDESAETSAPAAPTATAAATASESPKRQRMELKSAEAQTLPLDAAAESELHKSAFKAGSSKTKPSSPSAGKTKSKATPGIAIESVATPPPAAAASLPPVDAAPQTLSVSSSEAAAAAAPADGEEKPKTGKQRRIRGRGRSQGAQDAAPVAATTIAAVNAQTVEVAAAGADEASTPTPSRRNGNASSSAFTEEFSAATTASFGIAPVHTTSVNGSASKDAAAAASKLTAASCGLDGMPSQPIIVEARHLQIDTPPQEESTCTTPTPETVAASFPSVPAIVGASAAAATAPEEPAVSTGTQTESTHVDWADDDDDDSLPDLPEEWGTPTPARVVPATSAAAAGMSSSASAPSLYRAAAMPPTPTRNGAASEHTSEADRASKRGSKRGGKSRNKKAKESAAAAASASGSAQQQPLSPARTAPEESSRASRASSEPPRDLGLRIAGRAASNANLAAPSSRGAVPPSPGVAQRGQASASSSGSGSLGIRIAGVASSSASVAAPPALGQDPPTGPRADRLRGSGSGSTSSSARPPPHMAALQPTRNARSRGSAPVSPALHAPNGQQTNPQPQPPTPRSGGRPRLAAGGEGAFARLAGGLLGAAGGGGAAGSGGGGGGGRRGARRGSAAGAGAAA